MTNSHEVIFQKIAIENLSGTSNGFSSTNEIVVLVAAEP